MAPKRIFILNGHPGSRSISGGWSETYGRAACEAGHEVRLVNLADLDFDPDFGGGGYAGRKALEPDLEQFLGHLQWADHVVLAFPMWWGGLPAKLKGLLDRALLPGRTFNPRRRTRFGLPQPMLSGRTGRVMITSDTPAWAMRLFYCNALLRQVRSQIFGFIGIAPVRFSVHAGATEASDSRIEAIFAEAARQGALAA